MAQEEQKKPKRRIRKVETIREKNEKALKGEGKINKRQAVWQGFTAPIRLVGRGFSAIGSKLGKFKVFRIIGRILWPYYFRNSWKELRQVTWPTGKQTRQLTVAVLAFAIVFGCIVFVIDFGLDKLFREVLLK